MNRYFIKGFRVIDDRHHNDHPVDQSLLKKALDSTLRYEDKRDFIESRVDFGHTIALDDCVPTDKNDKIIYITRPGRKGKTRFVIGRDPVETSYVSVILKREYDNDDIPYYVLVTAYYGVAPVEPWDPRSTKESERFWKTHALRIEILNQ